jgi:hypothetical protein
VAEVATESIDLQARSKEIGRALAAARRRAKRGIQECADHIGTSWQRYRKIEEGTVYIGAVELEALVRYLDIPAYEVWPEELLSRHTEPVVIVRAEPGRRVQIVVDISPEAQTRRTEAEQRE